MARFIVFAVHPARQGVGAFEGIYEPGRWESIGEVVEAVDSRAAVEAHKGSVYGAEVVTAIPVDSIARFYSLKREWVVDSDEVLRRLEAAAEQVRAATIGGMVSTEQLPSLFSLPPLDVDTHPDRPGTREVVSVHEIAQPVDEVLGTVESRGENHHAEGATLPPS